MIEIDECNNCENCEYSKELDITEDLKRNFQCCFNPPTAMGFPTNQGIANMTVFPVVNKSMICGKFSMRPTIIN